MKLRPSDPLVFAAIVLCVAFMAAVLAGVFDPTVDQRYQHHRCPVCLEQAEDRGTVSDARCPVLDTLRTYRCPRGHAWVMLPEEP